MLSLVHLLFVVLLLRLRFLLSSLLLLLFLFSLFVLLFIFSSVFVYVVLAVVITGVDAVHVVCCGVGVVVVDDIVVSIITVVVFV